MRKLAILVLLVMAGCKRQVVVSSAPSSQTSTATANPNAPGGASHRDALEKFFRSAKVQDVQAMANVWGTARGPARTDRTYMTVEVMEQRIIIMMRCLRHDSYTINVESPAVADKRIFNVTLKYGPVAAAADFTTTPGPEGRFYFEQVDLTKMNVICSAK